MNEYTVTYKFNGKVQTDSFTDELDAVRKLTSIHVYENMELVSHSENIDQSKYRY